MNALNRSTSRRLQKLRQVPSVWEGDRRTLSPDLAIRNEAGERTQGECILWVDGTEGVVRAMNVVAPNAGVEAVVRTLLQAMEFPHSSVPAARPQKIVVRDRELQFFLRGVLQDLDITVDYAPELPLIDEIFRGLMNIGEARPPELPTEYEKPILDFVQQIWDTAPWESMDEEKIIAIELNYSDIGTLYVSILGMLGMEYGLLMYRSIESLRKFRQQVLSTDRSPERLEEAFLEQDCLFVTLDEIEDDEDDEDDDEDDDSPLGKFIAETGMIPSFGNLHPLEGMRPALYEEEAAALLLALDALQRFFKQHLAKFSVDEFPQHTNRYRIPDPKDPSQKVAVQISSRPDLAEELAAMTAAELLDEEDDPFFSPPVLRSDLIPNDAFYSLGAMPWETLATVRSMVKDHQSIDVDIPQSADGFPVVLIQTSRPKAAEMIAELKAAGGLKAICFNPGEDPFSEERYDLGVLQTQNDELHLFGEFGESDPTHIQARRKWDQRCKKTKGYCGLVIARGLKGASRGNPQLSDMMALFEVKYISDKELGLGPLQLMPYIE